jgi:hypothetical protein
MPGAWPSTFTVQKGVSMRGVLLIGGIAALLLGGVILVFAEGLRRYYSGLFFVLMAMFLLIGSRRLPRA